MVNGEITRDGKLNEVAVIQAAVMWCRQPDKCVLTVTCDACARADQGTGQFLKKGGICVGPGPVKIFV